ncbi:MAG: dTDP-4-dehydrorhamnose reductase [Coriobacteriaceae bacterium]|nr:dTDP-4-dehydrorhamnose reductase [Coriobacteriaceae bacterium]
MNILITGSKGQLGCELRRLISTGVAEIGAIPEVYREASVLYCDLDELDITDEQACLRFVDSNDIGMIINCAAFTNVDACESKPELAAAVNADGPRNLARAAERVGATLIHISTDYVFAGDDPSPRVETDAPSPRSVYGQTKLAGEQQVAAECSRHFIVRTAWLYGYEGANFVKTIMRLARENGMIKVVDDQYGSPTSANDLAYELVKLALTNEYGIYHCTNNGTCSWFEFASAIVDIAGIPCEKNACSTEEFVRPAKRPAFSVLDNARLRATIGDEMRNWRDALESYLENVGSSD